MNFALKHDVYGVILFKTYLGAAKAESQLGGSIHRVVGKVQGKPVLGGAL